MVTVQELKQIFLFKDVPDDVLKLVAEVAEEVTFTPGEPIAAEGEPAKALYLIRSGTVRGTNVNVKAPMVFGTGESFGQVSILDGGPIGMTLAAVERVDAIALRPAKLAGKLAGNHEAGHVLFRAVARSLAARMRRLGDAFTLARDRGGAP
ncbi:MAG TPA: Crp/Fnr family transcriptional regulator [Anaeromyxobacteraceae bacterium]|nr:Crp/Fnr family transcriptional regulator [Anaeromyxobacteraceae bacterium]